MKWIDSAPIEVHMNEAPADECLPTFKILLHDIKIKDEKTKVELLSEEPCKSIKLLCDNLYHELISNRRNWEW